MIPSKMMALLLLALLELITPVVDRFRINGKLNFHMRT